MTYPLYSSDRSLEGHRPLVTSAASLNDCNQDRLNAFISARHHVLLWQESLSQDNALDYWLTVSSIYSVCSCAGQPRGATHLAPCDWTLKWSYFTSCSSLRQRLFTAWLIGQSDIHTAAHLCDSQCDQMFTTNPVRREQMSCWTVTVAQIVSTVITLSRS